MTIKTNPLLFVSETLKTWGGDAAFEFQGEWYLAERDPETGQSVPIWKVDNSGEYIPLTTAICELVFAENDAAEEPRDTEYAEAAIAALSKV